MIHPPRERFAVPIFGTLLVCLLAGSIYLLSLWAQRPVPRPLPRGHKVMKIVLDHPKPTRDTIILRGEELEAMDADSVHFRFSVRGNPHALVEVEVCLSNDHYETSFDTAFRAIAPNEIAYIELLVDPFGILDYHGLRRAEDRMVRIALKERGENRVFIFADKMPRWIDGGDLYAFRQWVEERVHYPREAIDEKIEGRVVVGFIVEVDGSISHIEPLTSPSQMLSDEVVRVLESAPRWTPGRDGGRKVRVKLLLPVRFDLPPQGDR